MWRWLNPAECEVANQCLARGNVLEAARVLLASANHEHRAIRELRLKIGPQLAEQARQAQADGDLLLAAELITCAANCAELAPEFRVLQVRILAECDERKKQDNWRQQRLERAAEWAQEGRMRSAVGLIEPIDDHEAGRLRRDWLDACQTLDRYVAEFHTYLEQGQFAAAEVVLQKARELAPQQPQVLCLEQALRKVQPTASFVASEPSAGAETDERADDPPAEPPAYDRCVLSGLTLAGEVLVVPRPVVILGNSAEDWVDVPIQALIRRRHALLVREAMGRQSEAYRVVPLGDAEVSVNGERVGDSRPLADGDVLQLGTDQCRWKFRLPVAGSATALLTQARPAIASVRTRSARHVRTVVLLADALRIGRKQGAVHLVEPALPGSLCFRWQEGLRSTAEEGALFISDGHGEAAPGCPLRLPAELTLHDSRPGLQIIGGTFAGDGGPASAKLCVTWA